MDFTTARFNMVDSQIRPWEVLNTRLLEVLAEIPRERFTLPAQQDLAYAELSLPLANGGVMLEPKIMARLIQALDPDRLTAASTVLEIGTGSGYATAVLAALAGYVDTFDCDPDQSERAKAVLTDLGVNNITYFTQDGLAAANINGLNKQYDGIYLGGAVREVPEFLFASLKPQGKLVAIVGKNDIMRATVFTRNNDTVSAATIFDTHAPYLQDESLTAGVNDSFQF